MLHAPADALAERAEALADRLMAAGWRVGLVDGHSAVGGGSAPGHALPTTLVAIAKPGMSPDALDARLRALNPPIVARVHDDRVVLDVRTMREDEDAIVLDLLSSL
jgi:L-seryl-tRNA(Ser) seleniumtransferase